MHFFGLKLHAFLQRQSVIVGLGFVHSYIDSFKHAYMHSCIHTGAAHDDSTVQLHVYTRPRHT